VRQVLGRAVQVATLSFLQAAILSVGSPLAIGDDAAVAPSERAYLRLYHEPVTSTEALTPIVIPACASDDREGSVILLGYRPAGSEMYESVVMAPADLGCYEATIPAEAVVREAVEYYVKAEAGPGTPPAYVGHPNNPLRIEIVERTGRVAVTGRSAREVRAGERPANAKASDGGRPGSYGWRVAVVVVLGLAILAYALFRPKLPGLHR
jgi:hypothetical protein